MQIGMGFYPALFTTENFRFARQAGCEAIVAHMPVGDEKRAAELWSHDGLSGLKRRINDEGLELAALENFEPSHWNDVLLDGPDKRRQMEGIKRTIRTVGQVGIETIGYYFSIAGVWGRVRGPWARGGAETTAFIQAEAPPEDPIPKDQVWNTAYDEASGSGVVPSVTSDELWQRLADFLTEVVPVAEEAGVRLAAHPDDPPMPSLRGYPRLVYEPQMYRRLLEIVPSRSNGIELCMGTIQEMAGGDMDIYEALDEYSRKGAICYIHFRNVRGNVPEYYEVFLDEGDTDMVKAMRILHDNEFPGLLIPDHTPRMACESDWHAGMAYALGYMRAVRECIGAV